LHSATFFGSLYATTLFFVFVPGKAGKAKTITRQRGESRTKDHEEDEEEDEDEELKQRTRDEKW
jgi:hypothetical protein